MKGESVAAGGIQWEPLVNTGLFTWLPSCGCRDWCKSKSLPIFSAPLCVSYDDAYTYAFSISSSTNTFAFNRILNERAYKIVERIVAIFFPIVLRTSHFFFFFTFCIYISSRDSSGESSASFLCFFLFFFTGKDCSRGEQFHTGAFEEISRCVV